MTYPKVYVTGHKKKAIPRHRIYLTDSDYDYILEGIFYRCKIELERDVEVYRKDEENVYENFK